MKLTMFCYLVFLLFTLLLLELTLLLLLTLLLRLALLTLELVSSYLFTLILLHVAAARDHSNDIAVALEFAVPFNFNIFTIVSGVVIAPPAGSTSMQFDDHSLFLSSVARQ